MASDTIDGVELRLSHVGSKELIAREPCEPVGSRMRNSSFPSPGRQQSRTYFFPTAFLDRTRRSPIHWLKPWMTNAWSHPQMAPVPAGRRGCPYGAETMSIEYFGTPTSALTIASIQRLMDTALEFTDIRLVRRDESELGIGFPENANPAQETATILLKPEQVYVAFHACHKNQREKVIRFLESTLRNFGCECQLEED